MCTKENFGACSCFLIWVRPCPNSQVYSFYIKLPKSCSSATCSVAPPPTPAAPGPSTFGAGPGRWLLASNLPQLSFVLEGGVLFPQRQGLGQAQYHFTGAPKCLLKIRMKRSAGLSSALLSAFRRACRWSGGGAPSEETPRSAWLLSLAVLSSIKLLKKKFCAVHLKATGLFSCIMDK